MKDDIYLKDQKTEFNHNMNRAEISRTRRIQNVQASHPVIQKLKRQSHDLWVFS
jgi:hypothetical protein